MAALWDLALENDFNNAIKSQSNINNTTPKTPKLNIILRKKETHMNLVKYLHAACFSPVPSTFKKAIKKVFFTKLARTNHKTGGEIPAPNRSNYKRAHPTRMFESGERITFNEVARKDGVAALVYIILYYVFCVGQ